MIGLKITKMLFYPAMTAMTADILVQFGAL